MKARLAVAVGLGALLLWAALRVRQPDTSPPSAAMSPQPSAASPDVPLLQPPSAAGPAAPVSPAAADSDLGRTERPLAAIRQDYEREARDPSAPVAEQRIRTIYGESSGILRDVRCSESVCKLEARWSRNWNEAYNAALLEIIGAFSRELTLEAAGPPDGASVPVTIYVRRQHTL